MGDLDVALMELVNECYHMMTMGLCSIISAFQLVLMCLIYFYLDLLRRHFFRLGPQLGRTLFRSAFSTLAGCCCGVISVEILVERHASLHDCTPGKRQCRSVQPV